MSSSRVNVVFLTVDALRADHVGCYGYFRNTTPNIDLLAAEGVLFKDSYASAIATGPSFTCMITGKAAAHHRYCITPFNSPNAPQMDALVPTLAEVMLQNGFLTAAFDNMLSWRGHPVHFARGYNYYVNVGEQPIGRVERISSERMTQQISEWLRHHSRDETPFFLFAHYWLPHTPYSQPEPYRTWFSHRPGDRSDLVVQQARSGYAYVQGWGEISRMVEVSAKFIRPYYHPTEQVVSIDLYDGATAYVDSCIGRVLQALRDLDLSESTLVIVTSDHGEALGQHRMWAHGSIYDHTVHVPIILSHPDLPHGKIVEGFAQHIDLFPTIQEITGAHQLPDFTHYADDGDDPSLDGKSLLSMIARAGSDRDRIYIEGGTRRAIQTRRWKLIADFGTNGVGLPVELYDMVDDPMEILNVAESSSDVVLGLQDDLVAWTESVLGGRADPAPTGSMPFACEIGEKVADYFR